MKSLAFRFLFFLPLLFLPALAMHSAPFQITIIDQRTGQGVPHIRLTSHNGIVCYTRSNGTVMWNEPSLMDRHVYFSIESPDHHFPGGGTTLRVKHGGHVELKIPH